MTEKRTLSRTLKYFMLRLARLSDSDGEIAAGLAHGAAISWTPLPGTHVVLAAAFAWATRCSPISAVFGTIVGNPWTLPFMWWAAYEVGQNGFKFLGFPVQDMPAEFSWESLWQEVTTNPMGLFFPWFMGGVFLALITWPIFYFIFLKIMPFARTFKKKKV